MDGEAPTITHNRPAHSGVRPARRLDTADRTTTLHPVILSGGSGTRLWPLSRAAYPKQLLALTGEKTMLQATVERAMALRGESIRVQAPLLVCNQDHRFLIREQCLATGHNPAAIYLEPAGRNTAPAIALAALHLADTDPEAMMLVLPADHVIDDQAAFEDGVAAALAVARQGYLVTFGIVPSGPETAYGYIRAGARLDLPASSPPPMRRGANCVGGVVTSATPSRPIYTIARFVEKPNRAVAEKYLAEGGYTWNSGMFVFTARRYLEELDAHRPDILAAVTAAWKRRAPDLDFCHPGSAEFLACPSQSIDYAVMQATKRGAVVPVEFGWSDVGAWDCLWQIAPKDGAGNACSLR